MNQEKTKAEDLEWAENPPPNLAVYRNRLSGLAQMCRSLEAKLRESEAACAAMREGAGKAVSWYEETQQAKLTGESEYSYKELAELLEEAFERLDTALQSSAGSTLLARMELMENALKEITEKTWKDYDEDGGPIGESPRVKGLLMYVGQVSSIAKDALSALDGPGKETK